MGEMVEVDERLKYELTFLHKMNEQIKKQLNEKDDQINILTKEIKKLRSIFECGLAENHKAFQNKFDSMHNEYIAHYNKTEKIWTQTNEKYQNEQYEQVQFVAELSNKIMQKNQVINASNVKQKQCELMNELQPLSDLLQVFECNDLKDLKQKNIQKSKKYKRVCNKN